MRLLRGNVVLSGCRKGIVPMNPSGGARVITGGLSGLIQMFRRLVPGDSYYPVDDVAPAIRPRAKAS